MAPARTPPPPSPSAPLGPFVEALAEAYGGDLVSVVLYGSVARGEAVEGVSDVNLLVLVEDVEPAALLRGAPLAQRWAEDGHAVPLLVSRDEWVRSTDVLPIEIADMLDAREILHGEDPVEGQRFSLRHLRLQAEGELRRRLVRLRQGMLLAADDPEGLGALLLSSAPSVATHLRTVIRLARHDVPGTTPEAAREAARHVGADPEPFLEVWDARGRPGPLAAPIDGPLPGGVFELVARTAAYVDGLERR